MLCSDSGWPRLLLPSAINGPGWALAQIVCIQCTHAAALNSNVSNVRSWLGWATAGWWIYRPYMKGWGWLDAWRDQTLRGKHCIWSNWMKDLVMIKSFLGLQSRFWKRGRTLSKRKNTTRLPFWSSCCCLNREMQDLQLQAFHSSSDQMG